MLLRHEGFRSLCLARELLREVDEPALSIAAIARRVRAMFSQGIPLAAFEVTDIAGEFSRLTSMGVAFTRQPTEAGPVT